jgi:hypothetical protein
MNRLTLAIAFLFAIPASAAPSGARALRSIEPNATSPQTVCTDQAGNPVAGNLQPGSGPLIQHVKVFDVFYNTGNPYKDMLASYYTAITQSAFFDWLVEYNTASYKISRGSYLGSFEDTNSATTAKTLTDTQVRTYLAGLIDAAKVPAPDDDTMYMIYFPTPITITMGGGTSCANMGFCAYHQSFTHNAKLVRYGVMPDQAAGGCATGCGPGNAFQNTTDVSSHELIEAVTDPDGTGWYDNNCGEIGDICAIGQGEAAIVNGFTVQKEWSNKNNDCIAVDPNVVLNDFTITLDPSSVAVPLGGSATVTVTLAKKTGVAESVALTSPAAPTGLTAAFSPASVTSGGGTSTMTISAGGALTPSVLTMNVRGTGSAISETALLTVNVIPPADMAMTSGGGGSGGSGDHGGGGGCTVGGSGFAGSWAVAALVLLALAFRRRFV